MKPIYHHKTVIEALEDLKTKGFTYDFNIHNDDIIANPHNYQVKHVYRYDGNTDPGEESVVYGISSTLGQNGVFVAGFSAVSNNEAVLVLENLCINVNGQCSI